MASYCIYDLLQKWAEVTPDACAIGAPGRRPLSYGNLRCQVDQTVNTLHAMGVGRGDRVAIVLPNGPEMAVALSAVSSFATSAPLNPSYRSNEFEFYLSDMRAKALIIHSDFDSPAQAVAQDRGLPVIRLSPISSAEAGVFTLASDASPMAHAGGWAQPEDVALVLHTSGTTGRPKLVPLTQTNLCVSAENIKSALGLSSSDRCLNVMPLFHIHGLIGAMLSTFTAGGSIFCTPGFNATQFFDWMSEFEPTWYTAVPTMHQALLAHLRARKQLIGKSSLRFVRSCSSALPPTVMAQLEEAFAAPVVEAYGMTEASHQISINPLPPGDRKPSSVGLAAGQQVGIMDDMGHLLPPQTVGEVVVRGDNVARAYERDGTVSPSTVEGGWLRTGDLGLLDSDGYLFLRGRIREMINRGGEKISPREVEEVILSHAAVEEVVAFAVNDPFLGQDVAAAIVLRPDQSATEIEIQDFVGSRLADFKVPRHVVFLNAIPKGATGKVQRTGMAEKLGLVDTGLPQPNIITPRATPNTATEKLLSEIWREVLKLERVGMHDGFFLDLGGDSLCAAEVAVQVGQATGIQMSGTSLLLRPTVASLAAWLDSPDALSRSSRVVPLQPKGSSPPLFCTHGLWGDVFEFVPLAKCLAPEQPVYGLPGHTESGRTIVFSVKEMAARYVQAIRSVQPHGPYFLTGHSSGGVIAFEVARRLEAEGEPIALLALLDTLYPGYVRSLPSRSWQRRISVHARTLLLMRVPDLAAYVREHAASIQETVGRKIWRIRLKLHLALRPGHPLPTTELNITELHRKAFDEYEPQPYYGRVVLFRSFERRAQPDLDLDLGWSRSVRGGIEIHELPGSHIDMLTTQVVLLADGLKACLADARNARTPVSMTGTGQ